MPSIDSSSKEGEKIENLIGNIEFENVEFSYPSRSQIKILKNANFKIKSGSTGFLWIFEIIYFYNLFLIN